MVVDGEIQFIAKNTRSIITRPFMTTLIQEYYERSIQNLQQGQESEEELSVLDNDDGIIPSGKREWTWKN